MSSRLIKDTAVLFGAEVTYGTDPTLTGADNAMLVTNLKVPDTAFQNVSRDLVRPFLGGSEQLPGNRNIPFGFDVELVGSGTAGVAPAYASVLLACALAETVEADTRVDYTPITNAQGSGACYWHDSGVKTKILGARGNGMLKLNAGERPLFTFDGIGLDGGMTATSQPSTTLDAFQTPQAVTDANTADVILGCTHATTGAPALASGTTFPSLGMELNLGNKVVHNAILGGESVDIVDREPVATIKLSLTAAQEVANYASVKDVTLTSLGFIHGTVDGNKVLVFLGSCQLVNPKKIELNGKRMVQYDVRVLPIDGNDEFRIVFF
jgi:hypothetical protein